MSARAADGRPAVGGRGRAHPGWAPAGLMALVFALLALGAFGEPAAAETAASIHPSLQPDKLGASAAFTLSLHVNGGEESVPPPLRTVVLHLPAGLAVNLRRAHTCSAATLERRGRAACARALVGRGHALVAVHAGSQSIDEQAQVWAFRAPDRGGHPALTILGSGDTPLQQQSISTAVLSADAAPYGSKLTVSIPPIPTLMYEPDASILDFSLTLGASARSSAAAVIAPRRCPAGGFPFAADFSFADRSSARAVARVRCP